MDGNFRAESAFSRAEALSRGLQISGKISIANDHQAFESRHCTFGAQMAAKRQSASPSDAR